MLAEAPERPDVRKTNFTVSRKVMREFKRLMLDWEDEYEFPIELKESHCLTAAMQLIITASSPKLIAAQAESENMTEEEKANLENSYRWFMGQYLELLQDVISERMESDSRRKPRITK